MAFVLLLGASRALTRCCYRHFWGFNNVTTSRPLSLRHHFTLRVSTEVYGSRILSSIYILLTLDTTKDISIPVHVSVWIKAFNRRLYQLYHGGSLCSYPPCNALNCIFRTQIRTAIADGD